MSAQLKRLCGLGIHRSRLKGAVRGEALRALGVERMPRGLLPALLGVRDVWLARQRRSWAGRDPLATPAAERLPALLLATLVAEVHRRGGEVAIEEERGSVDLQLISSAPTPTGRAHLLRCEGWRYYSGRFGSRPATLAYIAGRDDGGLWAARVPGTLVSASEALAWLEPAAVTAARRRDRRVLRQGDVYAIETTRAHDGKGSDDLPEDHSWDAERRTLTHHTHHHLRIEHPVRFVAQSTLSMARTGGRQRGD